MADNTESVGGVSYSVDVDYTDLDSMSAKIDVAGNDASKSFGKIDKSIKVADASLGKMNKTSQSVSNAFKLQKNAAQQLSFQLQDVVVQAQMGTNWFTIIGQQAPQILGIAGAAGAALGVFVALAAALGGVASKMFSASDSVLTLEDAVKRLGSAVEFTDDGVATLTAEVTKLAKVSQDAAMAQLAQEIIDAKNVIKAASGEVKTAYSDLTSGLNLSVVTTQIERYKAAIEEGGEAARIAVKGISQRPDLETKDSYAALEQSIRSVSSQFDITREKAFQLIQAISSAAKGGDAKAIQDLQNLVSGLSRETGFSNEQLAKFQNRLSEAFSEARTASEIMEAAKGFINDFGRALDSTDKVTNKTRNTLEQLIQGLKDQTFTLGMSQRGIALYTAEQLGADEVQKQLINSLFDAQEIAEQDIETKRQQREEAKKLGEQFDALREKLIQQNLEYSDPQGALERYIKNQREAAIAAGKNADEIENLIRANAALKESEKNAKADDKIAKDVRFVGVTDQQAELTRLADSYMQQQVLLDQALERKFLSEQEYNAKKLALEQQTQAQINEINKTGFAAINANLEAAGFSFEQFGNQAIGSFAAVVGGAMSGKDAIRGLAQSILTTAIGALIKLAVTSATGQASAAATGAATAAALSTAYATPAALVSLASFGANSAPAAAGIASTVALSQGLALGTGRLYGGGVSGGKLYPFMEDGKPEALQMGGKTYLWTGGRDGNVVSNGDLSKGGGANVTVMMNVVNNASGATVESSPARRVSDDKYIVDVVVNNINERGRIHSAVTGTTTAGNRL